MEEQTHRRRRRPAQQETPEIEKQEAASTQQETTEVEKQEAAPVQHEGMPGNDAPEAAQAVVQHRRRRSVPQEQEKPETEPATDELFWHPESEMLDQPEQKSAAIQSKSRFHLIAAIDAVVCKLGDWFLDIIKWIGLGLIRMPGLVVKGLKKAGAHIGRLRSTKKAEVQAGGKFTGKRTSRKKETEQRPTQVTLEPTRPQDYQGMSDRRAGKEKKRVVYPPRKRMSAAYAATMAALICVALVSAYMVSSILWRSISTKRLNQSLSERYSQLEQQSQEAAMELTQATESEHENEQPQETPEPMPEISRQPQTTLVPMEMLEVPEETEVGTPAPTATPKGPEVVRTTKYHQVGGDALPEMEALYQDNRDLIGWLRMEGILDLPVVYRDNSYYLTHDFYKNKSASGTLFLDVNHPFRENAQNLLLHGHNMKDGTMFGRLVQYETNMQFMKNNPFIQYSTLWKKEQYVIFAVLRVSLDTDSAEFFNYFSHHTFTSDAQFEKYIRSLQNRSEYSIPISVQPSDALLTLSTCLEEDRLVIVARRLREGESKSDLRHLVQLAAKQ